MKNLTLLTALFNCFFINSMAQIPKTLPKEFPTTIPKHELGKPIANVKAFKNYITTVTWRGARVWYSSTSATVDSVLAVQFNTDGSVTWNKQGWEYVSRTAGTYKVMGNKIEINFSYAPYTHFMLGTYDESTGKITGTFTETRAAAHGAPPAYSQGTTTGDFNFYKNNLYYHENTF